MALLWALLVATAAAAPTVAVTGATGKLGRHAVEQLVAAGDPDPMGTFMGWSWDDCGIIMEWFWDDYGMILGYSYSDGRWMSHLWDYCGIQLMIGGWWSPLWDDGIPLRWDLGFNGMMMIFHGQHYYGIQLMMFGAWWFVGNFLWVEVKSFSTDFDDRALFRLEIIQWVSLNLDRKKPGD